MKNRRGNATRTTRADGTELDEYEWTLIAPSGVVVTRALAGEIRLKFPKAQRDDVLDWLRSSIEFLETETR